MQCTKCNSDNTQRLSVIYQSGTNHISTTSTTYGGGGSGFGLGAAKTSTSGTSQSYLAGKAAPPRKKTFKIAFVFTVLWLASLLSAVSFILFLPLLAVAIFSGYKAFRYNSDQYPGLRQTWLKSWHCNKCGTIYAE